MEALDLFFEICQVPIFGCAFRSNISLKMEVPKNVVFDVFGGLVPEAPQGGPNDPPRHPPRSNLVQNGTLLDGPNNIMAALRLIGS